MTREVVRRAGARGGRVLFTTSLNGSRSEPAHTLYDASKGAVNALTSLDTGKGSVPSC